MCQGKSPPRIRLYVGGASTVIILFNRRIEFPLNYLNSGAFFSCENSPGNLFSPSAPPLHVFKAVVCRGAGVRRCRKPAMRGRWVWMHDLVSTSTCSVTCYHITPPIFNQFSCRHTPPFLCSPHSVRRQHIYSPLWITTALAPFPSHSSKAFLHGKALLPPTFGLMDCLGKRKIKYVEKRAQKRVGCDGFDVSSDNLRVMNTDSKMKLTQRPLPFPRSPHAIAVHWTKPWL